MIASEALIERYGKDMTALVMACRVFVGTATVSQYDQFIATAGINWDVFYQLATRHHIRPVVFKAIHTSNIPAGIKQRLHDSSKRIALRDLDHARELVRLHDLFREKKIRAIPYKGCLLGLNYYHDLTLREASDIDFLVDASIDDIKTLKQIMATAGYIDKSDVPDNFLSTYLRYSREYSFDLMDGNTRKFHAEFHWFAASQVFDFDKPLPNTVLFEKLATSTLLNRDIDILSDDAHFVAITLHHGLNQQWNQLKYLLDLGMMLRNSNSLNLDHIHTLANKYGFAKALNIGLFLTEELLGIKPNEGFDIPNDGQHYMDGLLNEGNKGRKTITGMLATGMRIKDTSSARMRLVLKYVRYAVAPSILDHRFVKLPRVLFPLYAIIKPVRLLLGMFK